MFALIETKGASHIAIHIPHEGSDKSLPALAGMLEHNAVFIQKSWRQLDVVKPTMTIVLGDRIAVDGDETPELVVAESRAVLGEDFNHAEPAVMASMKKAIDAMRADKEKLQAELNFVRQEKSILQTRIAELMSAAETAAN